MKTYFNYESSIKSKDAAEAIASPIGLGPFCGFGSATLSNGVLTISPYGIDGTLTALPIRDRIRARYFSREDDIPQITFGVIAADGAIYTDTLQSITINEIQGSQGVNDNIIVYAVHRQVQEPVENPVDFVAYWSSSSTNFFELYKKSTDPFYPRVSGSTPYYEDKDLYTDSELTYENLCAIAKAACPAGQVNDETMVLVGIYGSGLNAETQVSERFAIVPYGGVFPQPLPYNTAVHSAQKSQNQMLATILNQFPANQDLITWIKDYIAGLMKDSQSSLDTVPPYTIVLYFGTTAPDGWAFCDGNNGTPDLRGVFVIGAGTGKLGTSYDYNVRGGNERITLALNQIPNHNHSFKDYCYIEHGADQLNSGGNWGADSLGSNLRGSARTDGDNQYVQYYRHNTDDMEGTQQDINIMPPYIALNYIMKLPTGVTTETTQNP